MKKVITILGGTGSYASLHWYERILEKSKKYHTCSFDHEYPNLKILNHGFRSFDENGVCDSNLLLKELPSILDNTSENSINLIACNSLFQFQKIFPPYILKNIDITCEYLLKQKFKSCLILCSSSSRQSMLFSQKINQLGIDASYPDNQKFVTDIIHKLMHQKPSFEDIVQFNNFIKKYQKNYDTIILACTELSLLYSNQEKVTDVSELVIDEALKIYYKEHYESL